MLKVRIEEYHNDNNFKHHLQTFTSFNALQRWVLGTMNVSSPKDWISFSSNPIFFRMQPDGPGWSYKIHLIEDQDGIIFSDGQHTAGQRHIADCVKRWLDDFKHELETPKFNFVNK